MKPRSRSPRASCQSASRVTAGFLLSFLAFGLPSAAEQAVLATNDAAHAGARVAQSSNPNTLQTPGHERFTLRQIFHHGTYSNPSLRLRKDVHTNTDIQLLHDDGTTETLPPLYVATQPTKIQRLRDRRPSTIEAMRRARRASGDDFQVLASAWVTEDTPGPNVTDKATVLSLAYMTYDAYYFNESSPEWEDSGGRYNRSLDVGWESTGLRGHVFTNEDNSTVVLGLKGTTPAYWDSIDDTTSNDKINDNLFGSCCCAQQGPTGSLWKQVCDCATSAYTCNQTCLVSELRSDDKYYAASLNLFKNVTAMYPNSNIWIAGHSLGGLVGSLLGQTYGVPVVTFEAVPDALASSRLGLPIPPDKGTDLTGSFHIGHTADPVYEGSCGSAASTCSIVGYAFEAQCHTGQRCVYDTVKDKSLGQHIWYHPIVWVINNVIKVYDTVPVCKVVDDCIDCYNWKFYEGHNDTRHPKISTTATSETRTRTRTETCRTPGWWGCLDESTTTMGPTTSSEMKTTTSHTCTSKGWFGCLDPSTTPVPIVTTLTTSETTITTTSISTSICKTPGWFGKCNDVTSATISGSTTSAQPPLLPTETASGIGIGRGVKKEAGRTEMIRHAPLVTPAPNFRL